jgi:hypothetical protein
MSKFFRVPSLSIHHLNGCFSAYRNNWWFFISSFLLIFISCLYSL